MRIASLGAALLALGATLAACGASSDPASTSTPGGPGDAGRVVVTYVRSGGIAGIYEKLAVDEDGNASVSEGLPSRARVSRVSLSAGELSALRRTLDAADLASRENASPQSCADCFVYDITYAGAHFRGDEATLPAQVKPAVQALNALIARAGVEEPLATGK